MKVLEQSELAHTFSKYCHCLAAGPTLESVQTECVRDVVFKFCLLSRYQNAQHFDIQEKNYKVMIALL